MLASISSPDASYGAGITDLVASLWGRIDDEVAFLAACRVISPVVAKDCATAFLCADGVRLLVHAMNRHSQCADVVLALCGLLETLIAASAVAKTAIGAADGIHRTFALLATQHAGHGAIVAVICRIVATLVVHSAPMAANIARAEIITPLTTALRFHDSSEEIVREIFNVAFATSTVVDSATSFPLIQVIPLLVLALNRGAGEINCCIAELASGTLCNLVSKSDIAIAEVSSHVPVVAASLQMHADNAFVATRLCIVLTTVANALNNKYRDGCLDAIPSAIHVLHNHTGSATVTAAASNLLCAMASSAVGATAVGRWRGIDRLIAALRRNIGSVRVAAAVCSTLTLLASVPMHAVAITSAQGVVTIVASLRFHANDAEVVAPACATLVQLSTRGNAIATTTLGEGFPLLIAAILKRHASNERVCGLCEELQRALVRCIENQLTEPHSRGRRHSMESLKIHIQRLALW